MGTMTILYLARHMPPAVSGGARRSWLLAKALRDEGARVIIISPDKVEGFEGAACPHPHRDPPTVEQRPKTLRDHTRDWLFWPDPDIKWAMRAARTAKAYLRENASQPDWVLTTSPPESLHAAGHWLARRTGARHAADFRDHWFETAHRLIRRQLIRQWAERPVARRLLSLLEVGFAVNDAIAGEIQSLAPQAKMHVLPHWAPPPVKPRDLPKDQIHLVHTGSFSLSDPDCGIAPVLEAFEAAQASRPNLRLHLIGRLSDGELAQVRASPATKAIFTTGVVPLADALAYQAAADGLVLTAAANKAVPPGKFAESQAAGAPIAALGEGPWRNVVNSAELAEIQKNEPSPKPDATEPRNLLAALGN